MVLGTRDQYFYYKLGVSRLRRIIDEVDDIRKNMPSEEQIEKGDV